MCLFELPESCSTFNAPAALVVLGTSLPSKSSISTVIPALVTTVPLAFLACMIILENAPAAKLSGKPVPAFKTSIDATAPASALGISSFNSDIKPDVDVS